jgi:hypothetical protein
MDDYLLTISTFLRDKNNILKIDVKRFDKTIEKKIFVLRFMGSSCSKHDESPLPSCPNQETPDSKEPFREWLQEGENKLHYLQEWINEGENKVQFLQEELQNRLQEEFQNHLQEELQEKEYEFQNYLQEELQKEEKKYQNQLQKKVSKSTSKERKRISNSTSK